MPSTSGLRLIKGNHPVRLSGAEIKALTAERVARRMRNTEHLTKANVYRMAAGAGIALLLIAMPYRVQTVALGLMLVLLCVARGQK